MVENIEMPLKGHNSSMVPLPLSLLVLFAEFLLDLRYFFYFYVCSYTSTVS